MPAGNDVFLYVDTPGGTYQIMARDDDIGSDGYVLYETDTEGDFLYRDQSLVGEVSRRFYQVVQIDGGQQGGLGATRITNTTTWASYVQPLATGRWYKLSMPINFGSQNRLSPIVGFLGMALARDLAADNIDGDQLFVLDEDGNWRNYMLGTLLVPPFKVWYTNGTLDISSDPIESWQSFWLWRGGLGVHTNAIYTGKVFTKSKRVDFRAGDWHMIAYPFSRDRFERDGLAGGDPGWGFLDAGGIGGNSFTTADKMVIGDGAGMMFYRLGEDGRWYAIGSTFPASTQRMRAGRSYYYYHRGGGFPWRAEEP